MTPQDIREAFGLLEYRRDKRRPPDERRRGQFRAGWEGATTRGRVYSASTMERLTWHNLGYRLGNHFGDQRPEQINLAFEVLAGLYRPPLANETASDVGVFDWRITVRAWCRSHRELPPEWAATIEMLFELAFEKTHHPERAWFGAHKSTISLVVGGIFLAAVRRSRKEWVVSILVDQGPPTIEGVGYEPVKSTVGSVHPLLWADTTSLRGLQSVLENARFWSSYAVASEKIHASSRIANDRDAVQMRRRKRRLSDFWSVPAPQQSPERLPETFEEGGVRLHLHRRKERNRVAVRRKREITLAKHGALLCEVCDFDFALVYGEHGDGFAECHHTLPVATLEEGHRTRLSEARHRLRQLPSNVALAPESHR